MLALLIVALAATGAMLRPEALFVAHFDMDADGTGSATPLADVGWFEQSGAPGAFSVEYSPTTGAGYLVAQNTAEDAVLVGRLDPVFEGDRVTSSVKVKPRRSEGRLVLRMSDEGDTPMIDVEFTPEGTIEVAGSLVATYVQQVTYTVTIVMNQPFIGPTSASVTIASDAGGFASVFAVPLGWGGLTLGSIDVLMPAGEVMGEFALDDFVVQANSSSFKQAANPK